ncbi:MAG TPA: sucrase ferredoxin [Mycobacteriales bacterium]|nr:sucrase ferredoxin [Mycobacteriales bacterium]
MTAPARHAAEPRALRDRCAFAAQRRDDARAGTAPTTSGFFLVEQPGGWGRLALEESTLDTDVGIAVARACGAVGVRPLLIRRPGRHGGGGPRRWFRVDGRAETPTIRTGTFTDDRELLEIASDAGSGTAHDAPLVLVCTHGRHDPCCAIRGRPVAAAFGALDPDATWECSHVGGDRFAGNVVVLPWGLYYGWVEPSDAEALLTTVRERRVLPRLLRGRSCFPPPVQAAQAFARDALRCDGVDDLGLLAVAGAPPQWTVTLAHGDGPVRIEVRREGAPEAATLTCAARTPVHPPAWRLLALERDS